MDDMQMNRYVFCDGIGVMQNAAASIIYAQSGQCYTLLLGRRPKGEAAL